MIECMGQGRLNVQCTHNVCVPISNNILASRTTFCNFQHIKNTIVQHLLFKGYTFVGTCKSND